MNQIRFDGLYHIADGKLWLRFYPGNVATARFIQGPLTPRAAAALISPGQGGYTTGTYEINDQSLDIKLQSPDRHRHYKGSLTEAGIEIQYQVEGKENPIIELGFHPLEEADLAPPQAAHVHQVRERLAKGECDRDRLEAAAAIGDPVSTLALRRAFDAEEVSRRFAAMGAPACLRVLLALCWSDDGEWYEPRQGLFKGGSKKEDEGKLLRTLAKWCLKPDAKLVAKAEEQFAEVVRVGPPFQFLDMAMRLLLAKDEAGRASALNEALIFNLRHDIYAGYEIVRAKVVPWLLGEGDPLAEMMKNIK